MCVGGGGGGGSGDQSAQYKLKNSLAGLKRLGAVFWKSETEASSPRCIFPRREGHRLTAARPKGGCTGCRRGAGPLPARTRSTPSPKGFRLQYGGNAWSVSRPEVLGHSLGRAGPFLSSRPLLSPRATLCEPGVAQGPRPQPGKHLAFQESHPLLGGLFPSPWLLAKRESDYSFACHKMGWYQPGPKRQRRAPGSGGAPPGRRSRGVALDSENALPLDSPTPELSPSG